MNICLECSYRCGKPAVFFFPIRYKDCGLFAAPPHHVVPLIADMIRGYGEKKTLQQLYLTISYEDLLAVMDTMKFDDGETDMWVKK